MKSKYVTTYFLMILILCLPSFYYCSEDEPTSTDSSALENRIKAVLDSAIGNTHVPGLVAGIWAEDKGLSFVYTAGVSDLDTKAPMDTEMLFRIGSNTKTFSITVLLQLIDEDSLELSDKISEWFPDFPKADSVTVEMLTNMRSGIHEYMDSEHFQITCFENPTKVWEPEELIEMAADMDYYFSPGTDFHYSNTNTIIAGRIIEMITGKTLEEEINKRIINKLVLQNTYFLTNGIDIPGLHPKGYYAGSFDSTASDYTEFLDMSCAWAAGSAISNLYDIKNYVEKLSSGFFLSSEMQSRRMECRPCSLIGFPYDFEYGMGIMGYKGFYGHGGSICGFTSVMMHSPTKNSTIVLLFNCQLKDISAFSYFFTSLFPAVYPEL
ncbi:serine hydrolase domain-containing protein [Bacteroidota bacterium]